MDSTRAGLRGGRGLTTGAGTAAAAAASAAAAAASCLATTSAWGESGSGGGVCRTDTGALRGSTGVTGAGGGSEMSGRTGGRAAPGTRGAALRRGRRPPAAGADAVCSSPIANSQSATGGGGAISSVSCELRNFSRSRLMRAASSGSLNRKMCDRPKATRLPCRNTVGAVTRVPLIKVIALGSGVTVTRRPSVVTVACSGRIDGPVSSTCLSLPLAEPTVVSPWLRKYTRNSVGSGSSFRLTS
mmetsp:Transcript_28920/g.66894  ORF Transcript_28920/g.66894 Transcript_28920/m.66894 type:complete len:243 (-) Transcript_28920:1590-2318(-)